VVLNGGTDIVGVGGVESGGTVSSGGLAYDYGSMTSGTVATGGVLNVIGSATGTTLQAGGWLYISSGGMTSGGAVLGRQEVLSGGVENGATVSSGGVNRAELGGTESGTTVLNGGTDVVAIGGVGSGTTISAGGETFVYGSATGSIVASGGVELVQAGGTLNGATLSGGLIDIRSGSTAGTSQINFTSAGGTLQLDDSQHFNGVISGFGVPGGIDLTDIAFSGATLGYTNNVNSGVLTITNGANVATIQVLGQYVQANFNLSNDGNGGVLVTDPPVLGTTGSPFLTTTHS
jgi:autotransporter passenger strand-loop-strand repeat protein